MSSGKVVIVLYTSVPNTTAIEQNQRAVVSIIKSKGVDFIEIDGANQENKDLRSILWSTPNSKRAIYPQVFIKRQNDIYEFIGDYGEIVRLNDEIKLDSLIR